MPDSGICLFDSEQRTRAVLSVGNQPKLVVLDEHK